MKRAASRCQLPELLDHAAGPARLRATGKHAFDVHREGVALFRALDHDRAALWIEPWHLEDLGRHVAFTRDLARERIKRFYDHLIARLDVENRFRVRANRVVKVSLLFFRQLVGDAG